MAVLTKRLVEQGVSLGHVCRIEKRGPWPEHGKIHPKYYVMCSCGYEGRVVMTEPMALEKIAVHLMKEIKAIRQNGGVLPANGPRPTA